MPADSTHRMSARDRLFWDAFAPAPKEQPVTHQTGPAATADELRRAANKVLFSPDTDDSEEIADRLRALASLLPALLAVADAAVAFGQLCPRRMAKGQLAVLLDALDTYREVADG